MRDAKVYLHGDLIELCGYSVDEFGHIYDSCGKEVRSFVDEQYSTVILNVNGRNKHLKVHRIVASSFPEICGEFNEVVNHLDENKLNNSASNLKWTTYVENLSWGNIREAQKKGIENKKKVIEAVMDFCQEVHIPYVKPVIKKTNYGYYVTSDIYKISMYSDFTINWRRTKYIPHRPVFINI